MDNFKKALWWLIAGSRGGDNRLRIIIFLRDSPSNANQLSEVLNLDYKTVEHHLEKLQDSEVIETMREGYGKNYFLTDKTQKYMEEIERIAEKSGVEK